MADWPRVLIEDWRAELGAFDVIADQRSIPRVDDREHFGFRDGISQPAIEGDPVPPQVGQEVVRAGEFVLGYPNQYGKLPLSPSVPSGGDRGQLELSPDGRLDLGRNGTFLVFRKLEQDVEAFWSFFRAAARAEDGSERPEVATYLAAKSVGRWPSGAPLVLSPERDDPALGADPARNNDFRFASADPHGLLCPVSSHIRRANPRDAKGPLPEESLEVTARHRIIRRGRMYQEAGGARGVLFVCVNANLRRQFEFLQQSWVCNPKFEGLRDERDPTTGNSDGGPASCFRIPARTYRRRLTNLPRFVHVRGGAYLFMPGIAALHWLAGAGAGYNANGRSGG